MLTALITRQLVYLSSGLHRSGDADLSDLPWAHRPWNELQAYSDSEHGNQGLTSPARGSIVERNVPPNEDLRPAPPGPPVLR
jgi:hypothetical protein